MSRRWKKPPSLQRFLKTSKRRKLAGKKEFFIHDRPRSMSTADSSELLNDEWTDDHFDYHGTNPSDSESDDGAAHDQHVGSRPGSKKIRDSYKTTVRKKQMKWKGLIPSFVDIATRKMGLQDNTVCVICQEENVCMRCLDCGPNVVFCRNCCLEEHTGSHNRHLYHIPEWWNGCRFIPLCINRRLVAVNHSSCLSMYEEKITIIALNRQYHHTIVYCSCCSKVERLVDLCLWPASPHSPQVAFTFQLMELIENLILECQVSLHDISKLLKEMCHVNQKQDRNFYKLLTSSFPYYRVYRHTLNKDIHKKQTECPVCVRSESKSLSMDANFRLCRKSKAAKSLSNLEPLLGGTFLAQAAVDVYVSRNEHSTTTGNDCDTENNCSEFRAGHALRSNTRFKALDETGVFGVICPHDIPLRMMSLKHGERLGYVDCMLKEISKEISGKINLMYDIGCKLASHWKVHASSCQSLIDKCNICVPIFHSYAHNAKCQYEYSPRNKESFGLWDGENMERLWSYLGKFCKMTKEMSSGNRIDVLTDALNHYSGTKIQKMATSLVERMERAVKVLNSNELSSCINSCNLLGMEFDDLIQALQAEESRRLSRSNMATELQDWKDMYVTNLEKLQILSESWVKAIEGRKISRETIALTAQHLIRLESSVCETEAQHCIIHRWTPNSIEFKEVIMQRNTTARQRLKSDMEVLARERVFLINTIAHHTGGQKQANRVSKLISKCTSKLAKQFEKYKSLVSDTDRDDTSSLNVTDVCDLHSSFWINLDHSDYTVRQITDIPAETQRRIIELYNLRCRANEEGQLVIADCVLLIQFLEESLLQFTQFVISETSLEPENASILGTEQLEELMILNDQCQQMSLLSKGKIAALLIQHELYYCRLQQAYDVLACLARVYFSKTEAERLKNLKAAEVHAHAPILPSIWLQDYEVPTTHTEEDDSEISSTCSSVSSVLTESDIDSS